MFDPKQEWDSMYSGKRISIEAVNEAQIRKNGLGPEKKVWTCSGEVYGPGPYYDPNGSHIHIWKRGDSIENFTCEQSSKKSFCQKTESDKTRMYCRICHIKLKQDKFPGLVNMDEKSLYTLDYPSLNDTTPDVVSTQQEVVNEYTIEQKRKEYEDIILEEETDKEMELLKRIKRVKDNWYKFIFKTIKSPLLYNISDTHSIFLWPWEMTPYQKFKYSNQDYKENPIFIRSKLENFKENYVCIE